MFVELRPLFAGRTVLITVAKGGDPASPDFVAPSSPTHKGQKVYRWGYTVRKCWTTLWGALSGVRVPRLRGLAAEVGLLEKYQRHVLGDVLFALTVGD